MEGLRAAVVEGDSHQRVERVHFSGWHARAAIGSCETVDVIVTIEPRRDLERPSPSAVLPGPARGNLCAPNARGRAAEKVLHGAAHR